MVQTSTEKVILNLGCGPVYVKGMINVDKDYNIHADMYQDLNEKMWMWEDSSVRGINLSNCIEHLSDPVHVIAECYRILEKDGWLRIVAPHATSVTSKGNIDHTGQLYTTATFDMLLPKEKWEWRYFRIHWFRRNFRCVWLISWVIDFLIRLSPKCFERIWCYYVGGADEMEWRGKKR